MTRDEYILSHISPEPAHLERLYRHTHLTCLYPRMCSGHHQGRVLAMLTAMIKPRRVLELGTFTGYSALCLAENLPEGAEVHTVEVDDEMADSLEELFATSPGGDRIRLHIGDALKIVPEIPGKWDMAYIDANKRDYTAYLDMLLPLMSPGGFILADNTLWDDKVLDTTTNHDAQTRGLDEFNRVAASHPRLSTVILPLRDGLTLMQVK
ncbi:MAG: O-methyltransferase [Muribaculaceae bacterium]|nr:O-methyltransferase [Muribaculaceae bacterium]